MNPLLLIVVFLLGITLVVIIGWRLLSRKHLLPCPTTLIWLLENRFIENVAGSQEIIQRAQITPGMKVLDAGCGPGRVTLPLAEFVGPAGSITALDLQAKMLQRLRERASIAGLSNIECIQAGLGEGLLPANSFDRAIMITVLGEIPDQEGALREIYRALEPGGLLSITEIIPDPHYQTRRKIYRLAEETGYNAQEVYSGLRAHTTNLIKPG